MIDKNGIFKSEFRKKTGVYLIIDYFSASFAFRSYEDDFEIKIIEEILLMICEFLNIKKEDVYREDYAMHRFIYQYKLSGHIV